MFLKRSLENSHKRWQKEHFLNYPPSLKTHEKQQKISKDENIISNETRKEPQPQATKYENYLPNTEKLWCKKRCREMTKNKKQTKILLRPQTLDGLQMPKSLSVLKVHSSSPLTTMMRFKGLGNPQEIQFMTQ